jgi:hypothetical protein
MLNTLDILSIDGQIRSNFEAEISHIDVHQLRLIDIKKSLNMKSLKPRLRNILLKAENDLEKYLDNLHNQIDYNFYIIKTISLLEEYTKILKIPLKITFMGRQNRGNSIKNELIKKYIEIALNYVDIEVLVDTNKSNTNIKCINCENNKDFEIIDYSTYICMKCYAQQNIMKHVSSYNDIDRVNISCKYMYDRKVHFRDCIKQYQGKQNSTIPDKIYTNLKDQFDKHHLLDGNSNTTPVENRFNRITKNHILMFLKELGYSSHYENVHLIHYTFTGKKPDDISYLEDQLLDDFDSLTDLYDKKFKHINRKNFINTQYVLYQLLQRHKHKCKKEEFIILKTIDRKFFHDEVCKILFETLGWNHIPYY